MSAATSDFQPAAATEPSSPVLPQPPAKPVDAPVESDAANPSGAQGGSVEAGFVDRRRRGGAPDRGERRQFGSTHLDLSDEGRELALAIDRYKVENHRRYLTCDELLSVIRGLGYERSGLEG